MYRHLVLLLVSFQVFSVSEETFNNDLNEKIRPYYEKGDSKEFIGEDFKRIHYRQFGKESSSALIILTGRTEPSNKYKELIFDLKDINIDLYIMDHRGQGFSERLLDNPQKGYVKKFKHYAKDVNKFVEIVSAKKKYKSLHLLAHSMGAAISLEFLRRFQNPFKSVTLSAPMIEIDTGKFTYKKAISLTSLLVLIGQGKKYAPGEKQATLNRKFPDNKATTSKVRYQMAVNLERNDRSLLMGGATNRWVNQSLRATNKIFKQRKKFEGINLLILQAENDRYVKNGRMNIFCAEIESCQLVSFPNSQHEILQETDSIRDKAISLIKDRIIEPK